MSSAAAGPDPIARFQEWLADAVRAGLTEPTAMAVATADATGAPSVRMMLLKGCDERGFVFYTHLESPKAADLAANPRAALCFHWAQLGRQVRVTGSVEPVGEAEADAYFATRPRLSQLGAWASRQSQPMAGAHDLELNCAAAAARFGLGAVPRPPGWSGFRLAPESIEFWRQAPFRLHERIRHRRAGTGWTTERLYP